MSIDIGSLRFDLHQAHEAFKQMVAKLTILTLTAQNAKYDYEKIKFFFETWERLL